MSIFKQSSEIKHQSLPSSQAFLARINPFLKMGLGLALVGLALALTQSSAMICLVIGVSLFFVQLKLRPLILLYILISLGIFAVSSAWLLGDSDKAIFSTLRLVALLLPVPGLALTTPPADLIRALQAIRLPSFLTLSVMLIWRFFPLMQQELKRIWEANLLRGVNLGRRPGQLFSGLFVPLIFQMVAYADDVTIGLQTRGYSPTEPRSNSKPIRWTFRDTLFCVISMLWLSCIGYLEWRR